MRIRTNISAGNTTRMLKVTTGVVSKHTEKLSSGYRINRAADDAAGLAISEKMRRQIRGLTQASCNCQDGVSMVQTAEGALCEVHDMLQRMNELSVQSANGTNSDSDREALQQEFEQIQREIDRVSETTTFNGMRLFVEQEEDSTGGSSGAGDAASVSGLSVASDAAETVCGAFTVKGGTQGVDFSFSGGVLTVLSSTTLAIGNTAGTETGNRIKVANGVSANILLNGVNINAGEAAIDLSSAGKCTISTAAGTTNTLRSTGSFGIHVPTSSRVTFNGSGTINAVSTARNNAAIGGTGTSGGGINILIESGTINATGPSEGAGIGTGRNGSGGNITITGGTVTAVGGSWGAGIGTGGGDPGRTGPTVLISGGTVNATGYLGGAGIGGGNNCGGGNITVTGGNVTAAGNDGGAAIGSGSERGTGGTFSTGSYGNAVLSLSVSSGSTDVGVLITDTSYQSQWDAVINGVTYGTPGALPEGTEIEGKNGWWIQAGAEANVGFKLKIGEINTRFLGVESGSVSLLSAESSGRAIDAVKGAIHKLSDMRSNLGAYQNRLEHTIRSLDNTVENTTYAESQIRDTNMAKEMVEYSDKNIIMQAAQAMLVQANQQPQGVLSLL